MRRRFFLALGGSLLIGIAGVARADATPDLRAELDAVKAELDELRNANGTQWLNERRAEEVKTLIRDVLQDADTRASLLDSGMTAGHNGSRFFLASDDGGFLLEISGLIQMRHVASFQDQHPESEVEDVFGDDVDVSFVDDEHEQGFELPRTKVRFDGHIADPRLHYVVQLFVGADNNTVIGDEIVISYELMDGIVVYGGEDKAPFLREEIIQPHHQLAADRTYVNEIFTQGVVQGVGVKIAGDTVFNAPVNVHVNVNDGGWSGDGGTRPHPLTQAGGSQIPVDDGDVFLDHDDFLISLSSSNNNKLFDRDRSDFAVTARFDVKLMGDWGQMDDFTASESEDAGLLVGAAIHYEVGETGDSSFNNNLFTWTVDAAFECHGWNLFAAVVGLHTQLEHEDRVLASELDWHGVVVQGGYLLPNTKIEPFVRWEYMDFDDFRPGLFSSSSVVSYDEANIFTIGANYYLNGHSAKFTVDVMWATDPLPLTASQISLQADDPNSDDQVVIRTQFQLMF